VRTEKTHNSRFRPAAGAAERIGLTHQQTEKSDLSVSRQQLFESASFVSGKNYTFECNAKFLKDHGIKHFKL